MAAASRSTSEAPRFPPVVLAWNNQGRAGWFPVVPQRRAFVPTAGGFPGEMASDLEPTIGPDWRPSPLVVVSNSEPFQHIINSDDVERLAQALELVIDTPTDEHLKADAVSQAHRGRSGHF